MVRISANLIFDTFKSALIRLNSPDPRPKSLKGLRLGQGRDACGRVSHSRLYFSSHGTNIAPWLSVMVGSTQEASP